MSDDSSPPDSAYNTSHVGSARKCVQCRTDNPAGAVYCKQCGSTLSNGGGAVIAAEKDCPQCHSPNPTNAHYCVKCHTPFNVTGRHKPTGSREARDVAKVLGTSIITAVTGILVSQTGTLLGHMDLPQVIIPTWLFVLSTGTAFALIALAVVFALALIDPAEWWKRRSPNATKGLAVICVLGLGMTAAGAFFVSTTQPSVKIDQPVPNNTVRINTLVSGTARNIPSGQNLWILLYDPQLRLYYPQAPAVAIQPNGQWSQQIYVGGVDDTGKQYVISAVLADQNSNVFTNYSKHGSSTGDWPGITPEQYLSSGAFTYQQNVVTRAG